MVYDDQFSSFGRVYPNITIDRMDECSNLSGLNSIFEKKKSGHFITAFHGDWGLGQEMDIG